jgi:hypothetical protein
MHENPHAGQGPVLLDIGGDIGALVVRMPSDMEGIEIEIEAITHRDRGDEHAGDEPVSHDHNHEKANHHQAAHVAVVARPTPSGRLHSLVYPELAAGRYELWRKPDGPVALHVEIRGGEVTETDWPH